MEESQLSGEAAYNIEQRQKVGFGSYATVYKIPRKIDGMMCAAKIFPMEF